MPSNKEIRDGLMQSGRWFQTPADILLRMKSDAALLLSYLINHGTRNDKLDDWFYCTGRKMQEQTGFNKNKQTKVLNDLIRMKLIETTKKGIPPRRWIHLRLTELLSMAPKTGPLDGPKNRANVGPENRANNIREVQGKRSNTVAPASRPKESSNMGFLPTKESTAENIDRIRADALHGAIAARAGRKTGWNRRKWADEFRRLRESFTDTAEGGKRIKNTLAWYVANIGKEYVPVVACAKTFRTKFENLEAGLKRHQRDRPEIAVGERAENIAKRQCRKNGWPKGSRDKVPAVAQISLDNLDKFLKRIGKIAKGDKPRTAVFAKKIMSNFAGGREGFVDRWLDKVHSQIANWSDWSGDLLPWAFRPQHKLFASMGRGWSQDYSGGTKLWSILMEEVDG